MPNKVLAQQLDVPAVEAAAAEGGLRGPVKLVAVRVEHGHAPHMGGRRAHRAEQPHPLHDVERHSPDVDRLAARP